jgi:hypothetical protein
MHDQSRAQEPRGGIFRATARTGELAAQLLDVVNAYELESFVSRLVAEAARDAGRPLPGDERRALVAELRRTAERTLPTLQIALGDRSRLTGRAAADAAARLFGAELEGMSPEDRDFEIARQFVRFSQARARGGGGAPATPTEPQTSGDRNGG